MAGASYIPKEKVEELRRWAKSEQGKKQINEICEQAYKEAQPYRDMTKIDWKLLQEPYTI